MESRLTHFDTNGNAIMVDVTEKNVTTREATARGIIKVSREVIEAVKLGTVKKGRCSGSSTYCWDYGRKKNC